MPGQLLVVNEWLLHDLCGDHGPNAQRTAVEVLAKLRSTPDKIAVRQGDPWMTKAYGLMKNTDSAIRLISKQLQSLLRDPECCRILEAHESAPIPADVAAKLPRKDLYLVETYLAFNADLLVTHDESFLQALVAHCPQVKPQDKDAFLAWFLGT
jgi:hypothetical protein